MSKKIISFIVATIVYGIQGQEEGARWPRCSEHLVLSDINKIADPLNSKGYFICENDILTLKYCEENEVFNADLKECVGLGGEVDTSLIESKTSLTSNYNAYKTASQRFFVGLSFNFQCPSKKTKNYPDEGDCRKYYHCEEQIPRNFTCPTYFLFDVKTLQCQFFLLAICFQPTTTVAPRTYNPPNCTQDEDIPYPYDCKHYFHCSGGYGSLKKCGWFFSFDSDKRKCRFSFFARCDVSEKSYSTTKYLTDIKKYISYPYNFKKYSNLLSNYNSYSKSDENFKYFAVDRSVTLFENSDVPRCGENDTFRKPYPGHCKRFYDCNHGVITVYKCLFIFNFDPITLTCRWFSHVHCNYVPPPSTTILTTEVSPTSDLSSLGSSTTTSGSVLSSSEPGSSTSSSIPSSSESGSSTSGSISSSSESGSSTSGSISSSSESGSSTSGSISSSSGSSSSSTSGEISSPSESSSSTSTLHPDTPKYSTTTTLLPDTPKFSYANYQKLIPSNRMKITGNKLKVFNLNRNDQYVCRPYGIYDEVYPRNCHKFYHCDEGDLAIESCSFFKDFDPIEKRCRLFFLVDCHARPEVVTTTEAPPPFSTETPIVISTVYTPEPTTLSPPATTFQPEPSTLSPPATTFQPEPSTLSPPATTFPPEPTTFSPTSTFEPTSHPHPTKITHKKKTKKTKRPHHKSTTRRTTIDRWTNQYSKTTTGPFI